MSDRIVDAKMTVAAADAPAATISPVKEDRRHIVHPLVDLLCLGGASLIVLPLLAILPVSTLPAMAALSWMLADVLNHPHFAASYQIFYRDYRWKISGADFSREMRIRYIVAGIVVPVALILFFVVCFILRDGKLLGWAGNLMLFLVGWHYVKQGYGMLIVDAVHKRRFFSDLEKRVLRYNAYACWIMFWLCANWLISERQLWGLHYFSLAIPDPIIWLAGAVVVVTTALTLGIFYLQLRAGGAGFPFVGTVAYLTTLYVWLAARFQPMALMFVPAFHSLQYLIVVGRYEANRTRTRVEAGEDTRSPLANWALFRFAAMCVLLGLTGFWWAPRLFDNVVNYDADIFGDTAFFFMFWIFINIHHYFMDNVIWRRENPETAACLFGVRKKPH